MQRGRSSGGTITVDGNRLRMIPGGPERLDALLELIDGARQSLRLLYYMYLADAFGRAGPRRRCSRAIERGVDGLAVDRRLRQQRDARRLFRRAAEAGARFCRFNPSYGRRYLLRNHQKLALADAESDSPQILVGGFNVADDYFETVEEGALARHRAAGRRARPPPGSRLITTS